MRILYLNNFYYLRGGSEKVLLEEIRLLKEGGHQVAVYTRIHERNESSEYEDCFPQALKTEKMDLGFRSLRTAGGMIYSFEARRGLRRLIERFRPDIAHCHNIYGRLSLSVLDELKEQNIPTLLTLHDLKLLCPSYLMLNHGSICEKCRGNLYYHAILTGCHKSSRAASAVYALESWINLRFGKYDTVRFFISPSRFLREKCIEYGYEPRRILHVPNFVDSHRISAGYEVGKYCLYLGRLSREKGVRTLLYAYGSLNTRIPLTIVGDGPDRYELQQFAEGKNLPVNFTGYLSGNRLADVLAHARFVIMPSEWYENAPLSLLEAFAYAKPVIAARIGGIPEMIEEKVNGFLFEPGNVDELKEKLEMALHLPAQAIVEMGRAAREKVEREFSPELHYERLMGAYRGSLVAT